LVEREGHLFLTGEGVNLKLHPEKKTALSTTASHGSHPVVLGIRPEDFSERRSDDGADDCNVIRARVNFLEPLGSELLATCSLGPQEIIVRLSPRSGVMTDELIELVVNMERARLFDPATEEALL
jgi:multiple sugar transport system ATP-binding protein